MDDTELIRMLVDLLRQKHTDPDKTHAGTIHAAVAIRAAIARQPVEFELARLLDAALVFLLDEIARRRDVGEYIEQMQTLIEFQAVTAAGYDEKPETPRE